MPISTMGTALTAAIAPASGSGFLSSLGGLSGIGSFASGLGSLGSAFGLGGKKNSWKQLRSQYDMQREYTIKGYEDKRKDIASTAEYLGLHPLSVIGAPSVSGPAFSVGEKAGPDMRALGQGIDRAINAGRDRTQKELDNLAVEKAKLSNDYLRTQIAGAQQQIAKNSGSAPLATDLRPPYSSNSPNNNGTSRGMRDTSVSGRHGTTKDILKAVTLYRNFDGSVSAYPSQELSEALEAYGVAGQAHFVSRNTLPFEARYGKNKKTYSNFEKAAKYLSDWQWNKSKKWFK